MRIALLLALAFLAASTSAVQPERFTLAIVRHDGGIVPFAAYDGGQWERAWPEADQAIDVTSIDNLPSVWRKRGERVPNIWRVWPAAGGTPIQAQVSGMAVVEAHCSRQVVLRTNLPRTRAEQLRKFGIAVDSLSVRVGTVEEVRRSDPVWAAAARAVVASFSRLETAQAARNGEQLPRETPVPATQITALYREARFPLSPLYFVAEKKYRTPQFPQNRQCGAMTKMTGWLVPTEAGTFTLLDPRVFLTDCDAKVARTGLPLAALRVSGQLFWVLQEHGYEDETYLIAEIRALELRYPIEVNGGGC